jgi:hypothetical protein
MTSTDVVTVSFVARVDVPMTPGALTTLTNRACAYPAQISPRACTWAEVSNPATYPYDMVIFKAASRIGQVKYGEEMTYTLSLTGAIGTEVALYDPLQGTEFLRFVEQPGTITHDDGVVTGTVEIGSGDCVTVRFAVRVTVPATGGTTADVVNSVQACPVGGTADDCVWSNEVVHTSTRSYRMYLPLIVREDQD